MIYLIGLGLNEKGITQEGLDALQECEKVYVDNYTIQFPYSIAKLNLGKNLLEADRSHVESLKILEEAKDRNVALLVYGSPLVATTHITIIREAKKKNIKCKVIHSASIIDAIAESGLQIYKFGKIASLPAWKKNYRPTSFIDVVLDNQQINAHTLILVDINLSIKDALEELRKASEGKLKLGKIFLCSKLGTSDSRIHYGSINELQESKASAPFSIIIPSKLHFTERDTLAD